ncbi:hypothetical protein MPSEU_000068800 [Mayamaea pseudoterrestris]|nr:hypothetical protein MPSEU_000068800 [Mayamaea pseudoterrestris]
MLPLSPRSRSNASASPSPTGSSPVNRAGVSPRTQARVLPESGFALPNSPLNRLGHQSLRVTSVKKQAFQFSRPRHHSGSHVPALPDLATASPMPSTSTLSPELKTASSSDTTLTSSTSATTTPSSHLSSLSSLSTSPSSAFGRRILLNDAVAKSATRAAQRENDAMVYIEGTGHVLYSCAHCRTHLTTHEDILSKMFQGRHGRAFLFDSCVNVTLGPAEERMLITGRHVVCDLFCKRCNHLVGWTYQRAYEASQKYKEGKFIIEKIHLYVEHEDDDVGTCGGGGISMRNKKMRSHSWGNAKDSFAEDSSSSIVYEYR